MTQDEPEATKIQAENKLDAPKNNDKQRRGHASKIVMRRLPPSMTESEFLEMLSPLPDHDSYYFVRAENSMSGHSFCRAYFAIKTQDDVLNFKDKWDGYVFLDERGQEYPAIVEYAPFQKMPRKKPKKSDNKCATLLQDADYVHFLETMDIEEEIELPPMEATVEELERRDRELKANNGVPNVMTPLIKFVLAKKEERLRQREEKREEKKKRDAERKKIKEEKRRMKRQQAIKFAKDGTIREESEDEVSVATLALSDDETARSETKEATVVKEKKERNRRSSNFKQLPRGKNKDRALDEELGPSTSRQHRGRNLPHSEQRDQNRAAKHFEDEPRRRNTRPFDGEGDTEEHTAPKGPRRERRSRNNDKDKSAQDSVSGSAIDLHTEKSSEKKDRPPRKENSVKPRGERKERPPRQNRRGEERPQQQQQQQQAAKKDQPKPRRYSEIRSGAQEKQNDEPRENDSEPRSSQESRRQSREARNNKMRNKDRPAMEIYKPGQRKRGDRDAETPGTDQ